jgi:hypothetical protein
VSFQTHIDLLHVFLARRDEIVERIQGALNAQRKPLDYLRDTALLSRDFEDCFFGLGGITAGQASLRGQLEDAHWANGFRPRRLPGLHNGPADPAEMMARAFYLWQQTRWPGRNARIRYAHTLFNLYLVRCLELLTMRLWDEGPAGAGDRLSQVQGALDRLWAIKTVDQPVLVKDARWLIQIAQSLATEDLRAYFDIVEKIEGSLTERDRIAIRKAGVRMTGGHLRSQIRYYATSKGVSFDDARVISLTRTSNALDFALLIQELVPLLEAYENALEHGDVRNRLELADAICQGISPDPELFVNRVDLLGAYSMIEHLFITADRDAHVGYTAMGQRHMRLLQEYERLIGRVSKCLSDDCRHFRPVAGAYSPYGALYGFSADLLKHMVLKASQPDAVTRFSLEDVFTAGDADTRAWVTSWRKLPHLPQEVEKLFDYPQQFAQDVFDRVEQALHRRAAGGEANVAATGRLFVASGDCPQVDGIAQLPARYIESNATATSSDWWEGRYLVSYETPDGAVAVSKAMLTEVLGAGRDAKVIGLPAAAAAVLRLMCPNLVVSPVSEVEP